MQGQHTTNPITDELERECAHRRRQLVEAEDRMHAVFAWAAHNGSEPNEAALAAAQRGIDDAQTAYLLSISMLDAVREAVTA